MSENTPLSRRTNIFLGDRQTTLFNRFAAKAIDALIVVALFFLGQALWPPLGLFSAFCLSAFQDAFGNGQSIGKRIIGLQVVDDRSGGSCSYFASMIRNLPFVLGVICFPFPFLWLPLFCVALPLIGFEIYLLFTIDTGIRLCDVLANSLVTEYVEEGPLTL